MPRLCKPLAAAPLAFVYQAEEDVLGADVVVVEQTGASSWASTTTRRAPSVKRFKH